MILARKKQSFIRRYYFLIALFILVLMWSLLFAYQQYLQFQTQRRTAITSINGIHCLEKVFLGGIDQWILIRGTDRSNPVLLFLHGGPGAPLFCFSRKIGYDTGLEQNFVMVYWEQRGAGKSFSFTIPEESMNIEQFISDTHELSVYLKKKFQVEKIFLLARSWGSLIGILTVKHHPELFHAYVGIGQLVHPLKNDSISYHHTLRLAQRYANHADLEEIKAIGNPPFDANRVTRQRKWLTKYDQIHMKEKFNQVQIDYKKLLLSTPEYSLWDIILMGMDPFYSSRHLWNQEFYRQNLFKHLPGVDVPVYFLHGRFDHFTSGELVEKYYHQLTAPKGKSMIWFEKSGHEPEFTEQDKFYNAMTEIAKERLSKNNR